MNIPCFKTFTLAAGLSFACLPVCQSLETTSVIPLEVDLQALSSHEGLQIGAVEETIISYTFEDGNTRDICKKTFTFLSQRFLEEDWIHEAYLFEPVDLDEDDRQKAILISHVYNNNIFEEMLDKYGMQTAAVVGIPVLVFKPNPVNNQFFKYHPKIRRSESAWQEYLFELYRETRDINVTSFAVIMKAKWRAIAAMENVLGRKLNQILYCGGSKAGASVRAMLKEDPRIISVVSSGSIPFATGAYLESNPDPLLQHFVNQFHLRPEDFKQSTIFFNVGSNDFNAPPMPVTETYYSLKGDRCLYTHPNGGHPAIADEQVKAMQLWASHVFHGITVPKVLSPEMTQRDNQLIFETEILLEESVTNVELSYACFDPLAGTFNPGKHDRRSQWGKAEWIILPMKRENGKYIAHLPTGICENLDHLNFMVRVKVVSGHLIGYVSSPIHNRESYKRFHNP